MSLFIVGALLVAAAAAPKWWHTIDAPEPFYVKLIRASIFACAVFLGVAAFLPRFRATSVLTAALACFFAPLLVVTIVETRDPSTMDTVMRQFNQAHWLNYTLRADEQLSYIPWSDPTFKTIPDVFSNGYTLLDGIEAVAFNAGMGWYICWVDAGLLLITVGVMYGPEARSFLKRQRAAIAAVAAGAFLIFFGPLAIAYMYWNHGRAQEAAGNYAAALVDFRQVVRWDGRWDSDMLYHLELGRLYSQLGETSEPDYWALVADTYGASKRYAAAYATYRDHVEDPDVDGAMRTRYVNALLHRAVLDFNNRRYGLATDECRRASLIDPTDLQADYYLGISQNKIGDYIGAIDTWKSVVRMNEGIGMFHMKLFCNSDYRKSITSRAWIFMGWGYYQIHDYQSALNCRYNSQQESASEFYSVDDTM